MTVPFTDFVMLFGMINPAGQFAPSDINAGDTVKFQTSFQNYTPPQFNCSFYLKGSGSLVVSGIPTSGSWQFTLPSAATGLLPSGLYSFAYIMTSGSEQYTAYSGRIVVHPNIATANPNDLTTHAERVLAAINSTIEGRANDDAATLSLLGQQIQYIPIDKLIELKGKYEWLVYRERNTSQVFGKAASTLHQWF